MFRYMTLKPITVEDLYRVLGGGGFSRRGDPLLGLR